MKMITGGAFQGKRKYAEKTFAIDKIDMISGRECTSESIFTARCIYDFHLFIRRMLDDGADILELVQQLSEENPDIIIITNEIGAGIIPIDREDRIWREAVGKVCCLLAEKAETVVRICCGIPMVIKGNVL